MKVNFELTDTFCGEANYSWVRRGSKEFNQWPEPAERAIVQAAKQWAGLTGIPHKKENFGDTIVIRPRGLCQILFITFEG